MNDVSVIQLLMGVCVGLSLSAACGFRVFLPLLVVSIGVHFLGLQVGESLQWVGTWTALVVLASATVCEVVTYYIPWLDNALDGIHVPLSLVAGTILMSGMLPDLNPCLKWCAAGVIGGGSAGIAKATSAVFRGASSVLTGGLGNCVVSTTENVCSTLFSVLAFVIPVVTFVVVVLFFALMIVIARKLVSKVRKSDRLGESATIPA